MGTPESEEVRARLRELESELKRLDDRFVRSDLIELKFESVKIAIGRLEDKVSELASERQWLIRLALGALVLAVIGVVLNKNGVV